MNRIIRLYNKQALALDKIIELDKSQTHYLLNVLRLNNAYIINIFNERDGEYSAKLEIVNKNKIELTIENFVAKSEYEPELIFCFAPIKKIRLDYMIQKIVEMGATIIQPVKTEYTQNAKLNYHKIEANIIEAVEQSKRINLPKLNKICNLQQLLDNWDSNNNLIFCDEKAALKQKLSNLEIRKIGVLIGPEGGFSLVERELLLKKSFVKSISLGKNILRADTAAVAILALVNEKIN